MERAALNIPSRQEPIPCLRRIWQLSGLRKKDKSKCRPVPRGYLLWHLRSHMSREMHMIDIPKVACSLSAHTDKKKNWRSSLWKWIACPRRERGTAGKGRQLLIRLVILTADVHTRDYWKAWTETAEGTRSVIVAAGNLPSVRAKNWEI